MLMLPSLSLPPLECCFGTSPTQSGGERRTQCQENLVEPPARLIGSVPGHDPAVELPDLRFQCPQLATKGGETRACKLRHAFVASIRDVARAYFSRT